MENDLDGVVGKMVVNPPREAVERRLVYVAMTAAYRTCDPRLQHMLDLYNNQSTA